MSTAWLRGSGEGWTNCHLRGCIAPTAVGVSKVEAQNTPSKQLSFTRCDFALSLALAAPHARVLLPHHSVAITGVAASPFT